MRTLDQLCADVVTITARPDLVASGDIPLAVRRATLNAHAIACFPRDLAESVVSFSDTALTTQSINTVTDLQRFRTVRYIREYVSPSNGCEKYFERQDPDSMLDGYGSTMQNIWYQGGTNINLIGRQSIDKVSIGYFQYPQIDLKNYSSWIADVHPFAIIDDAARIIFKSTGFQEKAASYDIIMAEHRQLLIQNFIDGEGR